MVHLQRIQIHVRQIDYYKHLNYVRHYMLGTELRELHKLAIHFAVEANGSPETSNDFKETSYLSIQNEVSQPNIPEDDAQNSKPSSNNKKESDIAPVR